MPLVCTEHITGQEKIHTQRRHDILIYVKRPENQHKDIQAVISSTTLPA